MHFGFSYVGLLFLIMLMVPNIIWTKHMPKDYDLYVKKESKLLLAFERIGQVLTTIVVLIFSDFNLRKINCWSIWLLVAFILMLLYEAYWISYFKSEKTMKDQYRSFAGVPVAGATLPVVAFFLLGIYGSNFILLVSTIILGIGHIGIHLGHAKEVYEKKPKKNIILRILKGIISIILVLIMAIIVVVIAVRNYNYLPHFANLKNGVDEQTYVEIGGQKQYLLMMGKDTSNPVIIYLHGGPASPDSMVTYTFGEKLMDDYTIIAWDERGCGRTYYKNQAADPNNESVSFEQALEDLDDLVDYACDSFDQKQVIIMGHSYGTILGSTYVLKHPAKVSSYIGVGQVVASDIGELFSYEDAMVKAAEAGDDTSDLEAAYEEYQANPTLDNMLALRHLVSPYHPVEREGNQLAQALASPYFGMDDFNWFVKQIADQEGFLALNKSLFDYILNFNAFANGTKYQVPVHFISGSADWICPADLVKDYSEEISAPEKNIVILDGCGHMVQYDAPDEFANDVKELLK